MSAYIIIILLQKPLMIVFLLSTLFISMASCQQQQDPRTINGGSILAMAGKNSVAVAVDKRFGSGPQVGWIGFFVFQRRLFVYLG